MAQIGVMHLTDSLDAGGAESVAVNLVNLLPRERYRTYLCTTRRGGALEDVVADDVGRLRLARRRTLDASALRRLAAFIRERDIRILHAHSTTLFTARAAAALAPRAAVIWHDHYGKYALVERAAWLYRLLTRGVGGVIAVNQPLAEWSRRRLRVPGERVWYVPNFSCEPAGDGAAAGPVPGVRGRRLVCVANLRPQKDHLNLVRAVASVARHVPDVHAMLVGGAGDGATLAAIKSEIARLGVEDNVSLLGVRRDVPAILRQCDIGVLSSASEGLPLALIEYGMAGLPAVATRVGQCAEVLDEGRAGVLVPPGAPEQLAEGLLRVLRSPDGGRGLAENLRRRVRERYSAGPIIREIDGIYRTVLARRNHGE